MMNVCFLTKYPPIQGGVSMRCYWLARGLAQRGHTVNVVTNAFEVEAEYRITLEDADSPWLAPDFTGSGGGRVVLKPTEPMSDALHHIPFANPFVSKLSALATESIRHDGADAIFSYYLEPYGVAAFLASTWTGVPYMVRHAGSDIGRLLGTAHLRTTYLEVMRHAAGVCTGSGAEPFVAMGIPEDKVWIQRGFPVPDVFHDEASPIDLVKMTQTSGIPFDPSLPTIGAYGKIGHVKGSFDLLHSLALLKKRGHRFNFVVVGGGRATAEFRTAIAELGLGDICHVMPFIPHWRIPSFIRACTCVTFLERDFPIAFHGPTVPREVVACGGCLVVSREVSERQSFAAGIEHGRNMFVVDTPRDHLALARALAQAIGDPADANQIGRAGRQIYLEHAGPSGWDALLAEFETRLARMVRPRVAPARARTAVLESRLPMSKRILGERWPYLLQSHLSVPAPASSFQDATVLADTALAGLPVSVAATDVVRYERAHNAAFLRANDHGTLAATSGPVLARWSPELRQALSGAMDDRLPSLVPVLAPHIEAQHFERDVAAVCEAIERGASTDDVPRMANTILFAAEPNFICQEYVIGGDAWRFLAMCDGRRSLEDLFAGARVLGLVEDAEGVDELLALIRELGAKGVLTFSVNQCAAAS